MREVAPRKEQHARRQHELNAPPPLRGLGRALELCEGLALELSKMPVCVRRHVM